MQSTILSTIVFLIYANNIGLVLYYPIFMVEELDRKFPAGHSGWLGKKSQNKF